MRYAYRLRYYLQLSICDYSLKVELIKVIQNICMCNELSTDIYKPQSNKVRSLRPVNVEGNLR